MSRKTSRSSTMSTVYKLKYEPSKVSKDIDSYDKLAIAIVVQAAEDYIYALRMIAPGRANKNMRTRARNLREDCEKFFSSTWYDDLTSLPSKIAMKRAYTEKRLGMINDFVNVVHRQREKEFKKRKEPKVMEGKR